MARVELAPALIIHRRAYRESSLLLDAFTREHGRLGLVARGSRTRQSRWRGALEPLRPVRLSWSGRGELYNLTGAEPGRGDIQLSGENLYAGFYAGELVMRLTARDDPHPLLFDALVNLLQRLSEDADPAVPVRCFECELLAALGYGLPLTHDTATGNVIVATSTYLFHPDQGLWLADRGASTGEALVSGDVLLGLSEGKLSTSGQRHAARQLLKAALKPHIGNRPLQTTRTLHAMRRMNDNRQEP